MKALVINCSLKSAPEPSSTEQLANVLGDELAKYDVQAEVIRAADYAILPGVSSNEGQGDDWPKIREKIVNAEILIMASPTWVGSMSSIAKRVIERMDAFLSETDEQDRPIAYNRVAGFVAVGNEDGAKHVIGEMAAELMELGFTIPGQSYTYFNNGVAMGDDYKDTANTKGKDQAAQNASMAAHTIASVARALNANPIPPPK